MPVHRIEVWPAAEQPDPAAASAAASAREALGPVEAASAKVYLLEAPLEPASVERIARELLADPVTERAVVGAEPATGVVLEAHPKPGVMDPEAETVREAIREMELDLDPGATAARTGRRYDLRFAGAAPAAERLEAWAAEAIANPVIEQIRHAPFHPDRLPAAPEQPFELKRVAIRDLDDAGLDRLSREGHLFLNRAEMRQIRAHYRELGREPTDVELETLAQTWSEHCVHKTLKATLRYTPRGAAGAPAPGVTADRPGHERHEDGTWTIHNLLASTVAAATDRLRREDPALDRFCVSVFADNSGIVRFDDTHGLCIKVETHNHPSAIEPYGGAATGIGGCIRDVLGTGRGAKPIANTDVFAVGPLDPDTAAHRPEGVIAPRRVLERVVEGVGDYGNRMGIPTVNGAVAVHPGYLANPLVFAGCVGLIPLDCAFGRARDGDRIVALGGRTGRDGIHGATFSSAELSDTHADEFGHAVQIGNPITQKKMLDAILRARDEGPEPLFHGITDCGAGGFSSAVGEMGEDVGVDVALERAPLKYAGLTYTEIWISEAQERMVLAVPPENMARLEAICRAEDVELADLGRFGHRDAAGEPRLRLRYRDTVVGDLGMGFLHEGLPDPQREAAWPPASSDAGPAQRRAGLEEALFALLAHPDVASKERIVRRYDHEVQGGSAVKPMVGAERDGPADAAVLRPKLDADGAFALGCGLAPGFADPALASDADPYWMGLAAIDEAVRNVVAAGADPTRIALLDNFCWPGCDDPALLGGLARAAEACHDGALAYRAPFVSGKDSLNNQFTAEDGRRYAVPPTLLVTALGLLPAWRGATTMDAKRAGDELWLVGRTDGGLGGSHLRALGMAGGLEARLPSWTLADGPAHARAVAALREADAVAACHDAADGGLLVAAAEMAFAGRLGLDLEIAAAPRPEGLDDVLPVAFAETPGRYLLAVPAEQRAAAARVLADHGVAHARLGAFADGGRLRARWHGEIALDAELDALRRVWQEPLAAL